jgi:nitrite reductase/ring-hydroxylating ferredoxin subunit
MDEPARIRSTATFAAGSLLACEARRSSVSTACPAPMTDPATAAWRPLCATADVEIGTPRRVETEGLPPLAVFQLDDGYYVTDDTCTHGEASLCDGFVEGDEIECPFHSGKFCIRDGQPTGFPATEPIRVYRTRVVDDQVCIAEDVDHG